MTVFTRFGSRFGNDLARLVLDEDVVAFCEGRGLGGGGEGGICRGGGEFVVLNGGHFIIGCFAEYSDSGVGIGLVEKNVDEVVSVLAAEGNCRSDRFAFKEAMLHSFPGAKEGVWIERMKEEKEREGRSFMISTTKMVERIWVGDVSHPGPTMDHMRTLAQKQPWKVLFVFQLAATNYRNTV